MIDFLKFLSLLINAIYDPSYLPQETIYSRDPALAFQLMIKDYGIDLRPKPYDPKLEEDKPKDRVIASSQAPEKNYNIKADKFSDKRLEAENREIDLNRMTETLGGFFNKPA